MTENPFDVEQVLKPPQRVNSAANRYCTQSVEDTVLEFKTDPHKGLSDNQDILNRRSIHGVNEFAEDEEESLVKKFIASFYSDPLILLLIGSAVISFWMGNVDDSISITLAITIVVTVPFGKIASCIEQIGSSRSQLDTQW